MNAKMSKTTWARVVGVLCGSVLLASCREGVLDPHGPVGAAERVILEDATTIMLAVVVPCRQPPRHLPP